VNTQLIGSVEKLFHYLLAGVKQDVKVSFEVNDKWHSVDFKAPDEISFSPTLYTRLDDCHGAGNCCRVPFDLVYSHYDRQRIIDYDHAKAVEEFGDVSAERFATNKADLLESLVPMWVQVTTAGIHRWAQIWVKKNEDVQELSGAKSCPYLFIEGDRYFCGVHPFKPLHCWFPHMTIRPNARSGRSTISIGRMQYGRNHNFGCPVLFEPSTPGKEPGIFDEPGEQGSSYFNGQFEDDIAKLEWASKSAASLGFTSKDNFIVGIHDVLRGRRRTITEQLRSGENGPIPIWKR
jgi:hypothetical protein